MARYGYIRVSTLEQTEGTSLPAQRAAVRAAGAQEPLFEDPGISGSTPLDQRDGGKALLSVLRKGDVVVAAKMDRMFRSALDAGNQVEALKQRGVDVVLLDVSAEPITQNGSGGLFFRIMAAVAQFERELIVERMNDGRKAKRKGNGHIGGSAPFGFRVVGHGKQAVLEAIPEQQLAIARMKAMRHGGLSLRAISTLMKAEGFAISHEAVGRVVAQKDLARA